VATTRRDYYEILGVPRNADERAIKSAFRRLARELHPDVSDHPEAQERFREAAEAYEVLSKAETRELYDRYGHDGLRTGGFRPTDFDFGSLNDLFSAFFGDDLFGEVGGRGGRRSARGADVLAEVEVTLVEAAEGATRSVPFPAVVDCATCHGSGAAPGTSPTTCADCGGTGRLQTVSSSFLGQIVRTQACPRCGGLGEVVETPCPECDGAGRLTEERELEVEIPRGIHDGQRIRLGGEGHAGVLGGRSGDLYVLVHVQPDDRFVREGNDIVSAVELTMTQAALGASLQVETLDGELALDFAPGTQPGDIRVLRGKGMPVLQGRGRGDHRVLIDVRIPAHLTDEQRRLLEDFGHSEHERNYGTDVGFFEKLRSAFR
jgi:molecular chaperone DnaJ